MRLTHRDLGGTRIPVVEVDGEVDLTVGPALRQQVIDVGNGGGRVVVDLSRVDFFDSTGLRALDEARADLEAAGGRVVLAGVTPRVLRLFQITGLDTQFALYPTADAAVSGYADTGVDDGS